MNAHDLEKGLAALTAAADANNPTARRRDLFAKSEAGTISSEENAELLKSLGGEGGLRDDVLAPLQDNETIAKSVDVSDHLREYNGAIVDALGTLSDHITKSEASDQGFRIALAQTLTSVSDLVKSVDSRLAAVEGSPARAPKSLGIPQEAATLEKSAFSADGLDRTGILATMQDMIKGGAREAAGEDLIVAATQYELSSTMSKSMLSAVTDHHRQGLAN